MKQLGKARAIVAIGAIALVAAACGSGGSSGDKTTVGVLRTVGGVGNGFREEQV